MCDNFNQGSFILHLLEIIPEQLRSADEIYPLTHTILPHHFSVQKSGDHTKNVLFLVGHRREEDKRAGANELMGSLEIILLLPL